MSMYDVAAAIDEFMVVLEYSQVKKRSDACQSEAALKDSS